jgi:exodeoxyribonuclease-5
MREEELESGDAMMVVKNNYFWLPDESKAGFIANGDIIEIIRIRGFEEMYGFHFADVTVSMADYPDEKELDVKLLLDTISSESPSLTYDDNQTLFQNVMEDYKDIPQRKKRMEQLKSNPYFNALQVKFAYALTCHKTQGGQWDQVFVEQGFFKEDMLTKDYLRWLYTALTRASEELYLINFNREFYEDDKPTFYYD